MLKLSYIRRCSHLSCAAKTRLTAVLTTPGIAAKHKTRAPKTWSASFWHFFELQIEVGPMSNVRTSQKAKRDKLRSAVVAMPVAPDISLLFADYLATKGCRCQIYSWVTADGTTPPFWLSHLPFTHPHKANCAICWHPSVRPAAVCRAQEQDGETRKRTDNSAHTKNNPLKPTVIDPHLFQRSRASRVRHIGSGHPGIFFSPCT